MKTRKRTQAAFAQPEVSWSRKRSMRMVIRIRIQITKKNTSKATSSASPMLISANGKAASFRSWINGGGQNAAVTRSAGYALCPLRASVISASSPRVGWGAVDRSDSEAPREEHGGDGGGQVEAGDARSHRDRKAGVGPVQQLGAQPVALRSEGKGGAGGEGVQVGLAPLGIDGAQRAAPRRQGVDRRHRQ